MVYMCFVIVVASKTPAPIPSKTPNVGRDCAINVPGKSQLSNSCWYLYNDDSDDVLIGCKDGKISELRGLEAYEKLIEFLFSIENPCNKMLQQGYGSTCCQ